MQTRVDQTPQWAGIHPLSPGCARLCSASGDPRRADRIGSASGCPALLFGRGSDRPRPV